MTLSFSNGTDASYLKLSEGTYDQSLPFDFARFGVTLNIDLDEGGRVLGVEVLGMSKLGALLSERGKLELPEVIEDPDAFGEADLFIGGSASGRPESSVAHA